MKCPECGSRATRDGCEECSWMPGKGRGKAILDTNPNPRHCDHQLNGVWCPFPKAWHDQPRGPGWCRYHSDDAARAPGPAQHEHYRLFTGGPNAAACVRDQLAEWYGDTTREMVEQRVKDDAPNLPDAEGPFCALTWQRHEREPETAYQRRMLATTKRLARGVVKRVPR